MPKAEGQAGQQQIPQSQLAELLPHQAPGLENILKTHPHRHVTRRSFIEIFEFRSTPGSEELLKAVTLLRELNRRNMRRVPDEAPIG